MRLQESIYWALTAWRHWGNTSLLSLPATLNIVFSPTQRKKLRMQSVRVTQLISDSWATTLSCGSDWALHIPSALWKRLSYVWVSWRQRSRVGCNSFLIKMKYHVLHSLPTSRFLWFRIWFQLLLATGSCPMGSGSLFHLPETEEELTLPLHQMLRLALSTLYLMQSSQALYGVGLLIHV